MGLFLIFFHFSGHVVLDNWRKLLGLFVGFSDELGTSNRLHFAYISSPTWNCHWHPKYLLQDFVDKNGVFCAETRDSSIKRLYRKGRDLAWVGTRTAKGGGFIKKTMVQANEPCARFAHSSSIRTKARPKPVGEVWQWQLPYEGLLFHTYTGKGNLFFILLLGPDNYN
ncbi:hypothetical protein Goshw_015917 [Gossypium schwendimanii]|uniref:Uncharacterized protein n=1 Tax=Gossypium schwendimanii TaxID=34291 RepID=A0A7J9MCC7_GOSSC|nr:hypothetical protein [Gossypium schwendimanii]